MPLSYHASEYHPALPSVFGFCLHLSKSLMFIGDALVQISTGSSIYVVTTEALRNTPTREEKAARLVRRVVAHRRKLKARAIEYKGGKCSLCGYNRCNAALEFHHLDPKQKGFGLSRSGITRSWDSIRHELDKCVLICANCHREVEAGARPIPAEVTASSP